MKKLLAILSLVLALALLIACNPQPPASPTPTSSPKPTTPTLSPSSSPTIKPSPTVVQPKFGGILNVPMATVPPGYDNHRRPSYGPFLGYPIFSNLVRFDPDQYELDPKNIIPDLAQRWETSSDGKVWTFYLYKGVKWHDGKPFTADDVVYSFEKIKDPTKSSIAGLFSTLERFEKVDDFTVKAYLKTTSPSFFLQLAGPFTNIQAKHLASVDWKTTDFMIGTGPFKFKSYVSGVSFQLVKNPDYFRKDAAGTQLPYLDGITFYTVADHSAQMDAIATKRFDMAQPVLGVWDQQSKDKLNTIASQLHWQQYANPYGSGFWFNPKSAVIKDVRVRQAIVMLMDRPSLTVAGFGDPSWGEYNHAFLAPAFGLPTAEINKLTGWGLTPDQKVAQAKKLMSDAGAGSGFKLRILVRNVSNLTREVTLLADSLKRNLNIETEMIAQELVQQVETRKTMNWDIDLDDVASYVGDPQEILVFFRTGNPANFLGYSNPEMDKLIDAQNAEMDLAKRVALTQQIERMILTDLPAVPDAWRKYWHAEWPYVQGFKIQQVGYGSRMAFERVWLNK